MLTFLHLNLKSTSNRMIGQQKGQTGYRIRLVCITREQEKSRFNYLKFFTFAIYFLLMFMAH